MNTSLNNVAKYRWFIGTSSIEHMTYDAHGFSHLDTN
jgi:hypothetical protein